MSFTKEQYDLIHAYIAAFQGETTYCPSNLAIQYFLDLPHDNPEMCWKMINGIISFNPNEKVIGALSAGPLEDLIHYFGETFIERIEENARKNPAFRFLLGGVWEVGSKEIWARILKARNGISW